MKKLLLFAPALFLLSCGGETEKKIDYIETEYDKQIAEYLEGEDWEPTREDNGLYIYTEIEGEGQKPGLQDYLTLNYSGYLLDGTVFDGTNGEAITFPFPMESLIKGWQQGIPAFGKGGKGKLIIPPDLGYGERASGPIPANSVLVFDIELIDFAPTPPLPPDYSDDIEAYISENNLGEFTKSETGLYVLIEKEGESSKPTVQSTVTMKYKGTLLSGLEFDGNDDFNYPLSSLIPGWQEGIPYFGKGGKGILLIPPHLGYGDRANGDIPANSILRFDIELSDFTDVPLGQNM
jgi:FKBP-type peptidyl-prolyl cis-trans isomerase FkpA